jgi:hypothetical protein
MKKANSNELQELFNRWDKEEQILAKKEAKENNKPSRNRFGYAVGPPTGTAEAVEYFNKNLRFAELYGQNLKRAAKVDKNTGNCNDPNCIYCGNGTMTGVTAP